MNLQEILDAREKRTLFLNNKLDGNTLVITFSLNIPGLNKLGNDKRIFIEKYFYEYLKYVNKRSNQVSYDLLTDANGYIYYLYLDIKNINPIDLKKDALKFEESVGDAGKIIDIDIYLALTKKISRQDIAKLARKCFLCDNFAKECAFLQKHSEADLLSFVNKTINLKTPFILSEEFIFADILKRISDGELSEGDRLKEEELSERYNVSRTKIREVIKKLKEDDLVTLKKHIGAKIKVLNNTEIKEILELRILLKRIIFKNVFNNYLKQNYFMIDDVKNRILKIKENDYELKAIWNIEIHTFLFSLSTKYYTKSYYNKLETTFACINRKIKEKILKGEFDLLKNFLIMCDSIIKRDEKTFFSNIEDYFNKIESLILSFKNE
ncbi:citrate lyase holo-[acyl-carrier protein] synthase [Mesoplasma melaleucae]|uniref:citrate lyase holo-[acyl-carrier protein] synthase n=1 Tax=Mesoplasma melaleucae TaxID=81459 RepID=A0A2K8NUW4_9MOLU|nr:citrate lyase holo-[acyl-carrier protein] synthase [Mesoplasma melaleucae]ATZ17635.1 hypothetical protein EMELA_v1c00430 [Mesoplasma melaleucae]